MMQDDMALLRLKICFPQSYYPIFAICMIHIIITGDGNSVISTVIF